MDNITVNGIVLSSMPIGEYDRRVELLTGELGRISAFARGARRPQSALVSLSRVFAAGKFELYQGRNSYSLNGAQISNYFTELSENVEVSYYGFYFLELARFFSRENAEAWDMLRLLYQSLRALLLETLDNRLVRAVYELKMLDVNGVCPPVDRITSGQGAFTFGEGLDPSTVYALSYVIRSKVGTLFTFRLTEPVQKEFCEVVTHLVNMSVDREFNSLKLLETLV